MSKLRSPSHGREARRTDSAVWTSDSAVVLLDGIEANEQGKRLAEARLRALHPLSEGKDHHSTDFEKRLRKIFENESADRDAAVADAGVLAAGN